MQDTVTATICRCGWVSVAPSFGDSVEMFNEHSNGEEGKHVPSTVMGVSSPVPADAMAYFLRKSHILAAESRALDNLANWRTPPEPVRVHDDGLGVFRGIWTLVKWYAMVGVALLCCWGLWRLS
jgi:hypothetical protein